MTVVEKPEIAAGKFLPIYLEALRLDSIVDFDLYIKMGHELVLYRAANLPFTEKTRANLLDNLVKKLYVPADSQERYQKYIEANIDQIVRDREIPERAKAGIVYDSTKMLIKDVLTSPNLGENVRRSQTMVEASVVYIVSSQEAFHNLLKVMSFDYYTYTHSVNVCTFAVAFARHLGYNDEEMLNHLGVGALLHDVGKTRIPDRILNKKSRLNPREMEMIRRHPRYGFDILQETNLVHSDCYYPVIQHHERMDGSGYPEALTGDKIHIFGKITAIADTFDAMT
ncbi:MAG: HD domain-containing protein, partial [candidate division Zixibacteria bacterium]|nr:HD domain-containing protein [candidate division Zixibacteria bacterium]